ncbi:DUF6476 family protein [Cereibacter azotoformans]|nr:DUF6476 family protein [Cereibacter azotoformans]AXQ93600.1 hypothetical protein D0Z66_07150 [Cereibacter sphaeroides]MBO4168631.1 hypothetical protein [Cereibacter azotoformans]UIJ31938.1 DUF6476 family protein [Cereibacter azotoformans]ULB09769.1 DUF6476 family protein [Cereibacter azotoformans]
MQQAPEPEGRLPPSLGFLKWLVIILTLTMIGGVITVVTVIVTRMPTSLTPTPLTLPEELTLPEGTRAEAFTRGRDWLGVVTEDGRLLIFETDGRLRQEVRLVPAAP